MGMKISDEALHAMVEIRDDIYEATKTTCPFCGKKKGANE